MSSDPATLPFTASELNGISVLLSSPESENVRAGGKKKKILGRVYSKYSNRMPESREWKELAQGHTVTEMRQR